MHTIYLPIHKILQPLQCFGLPLLVLHDFLNVIHSNHPVRRVDQEIAVQEPIQQIIVTFSACNRVESWAEQGYAVRFGILVTLQKFVNVGVDLPSPSGKLNRFHSCC